MIYTKKCMTFINIKLYGFSITSNSLWSISRFNDLAKKPFYYNNEWLYYNKRILWENADSGISNDIQKKLI